MTRSNRAILGAVAIMSVTAGPASAHTEVVRTSPVSGATVTVIPRRITITYEGSLLRVVNVTVTRRAGGQIARSAKVNAKDAHQVVVLTSAGAPGRYMVAWKVQGADAHIVAGTFGFTVKRPRPTT